MMGVSSPATAMCCPSWSGAARWRTACRHAISRSRPSTPCSWMACWSPAELLINGRSVVQLARVDTLTHFHVELESHDILLAEGAAAESFVDCASRAMFQNAHAFAALYPDDRAPGWAFCAPRVEDGAALADIRRRIAGRAGLAADHANDAPVPGALQGCIDVFDHAHDGVGVGLRPGTAAHRDATGGVGSTARTSLISPRTGIAMICRGSPKAMGVVRCAFMWRLPEPLSPDRPHAVELRRAADGSCPAKKRSPPIHASLGLSKGMSTPAHQGCSRAGLWIRRGLRCLFGWRWSRVIVCWALSRPTGFGRIWRIRARAMEIAGSYLHASHPATLVRSACDVSRIKRLCLACRRQVENHGFALDPPAPTSPGPHSSRGASVLCA